MAKLFFKPDQNPYYDEILLEYCKETISLLYNRKQFVYITTVNYMPDIISNLNKNTIIISIPMFAMYINEPVYIPKKLNKVVKKFDIFESLIRRNRRLRNNCNDDDDDDNDDEDYDTADNENYHYKSNNNDNYFIITPPLIDTKKRKKRYDDDDDDGNDDEDNNQQQQQQQPILQKHFSNSDYTFFIQLIRIMVMISNWYYKNYKNNYKNFIEFANRKRNTENNNNEDNNNFYSNENNNDDDDDDD